MRCVPIKPLVLEPQVRKPKERSPEVAGTQGIAHFVAPKEHRNYKRLK
jgi:hypothetical protein